MNRGDFDKAPVFLGMQILKTTCPLMVAKRDNFFDVCLSILLCWVVYQQTSAPPISRHYRKSSACGVCLSIDTESTMTMAHDINPAAGLVSDAATRSRHLDRVGAALLLLTSILLCLALTQNFIVFDVQTTTLFDFLRASMPEHFGAMSDGALESQFEMMVKIASMSIKDVDLATVLHSHTHREFSVLSSLRHLLESGNLVASMLVLVFSVLFPVMKLLGAARHMLGSRKANGKVVGLLGSVHRFAMLDVLVVALMVIMFSSATPMSIKVGAGFYAFVAYWFAQAGTNVWLQRGRKESSDVSV